MHHSCLLELPIVSGPLPLVLSLGLTKQHGPILLTPAIQIFTSTDKIPSEPSLLQAEQLQGYQPFFLRELLHGPFCDPLLDYLQKFPVFLKTRNPEQGAVLQMWPHCFGQLCLTLIVARPSLHPCLLFFFLIPLFWHLCLHSCSESWVLLRINPRTNLSCES